MSQAEADTCFTTVHCEAHVTSSDNSPKKADVYYIKSPDQRELLASTRLQPIGDLLSAKGPMSVKEIAAALGQRPSALYHHIKKAVKAGLIVETGSRTINRRKEVLYDTPAVKMRFGFSVADKKLKPLWRKIQTAHSRQADRDFIGALDNSKIIDDGPQRNLRTFRLVGAPDPVALSKINQKIEEISALMWESAGQDNPLIAITCVVAPMPPKSSLD
ncbi:winged helix-turn-helix domain-containing protein [Hyphococcus flavus]|uniref:Winged helix-turn-helix domain-containing protein n=1 Tax=Hyphococcus flavus TaxID=1866326 RepID=A0AAE9ZD48_9PROT|nr:winged helix-turn-helix domain-containing protein [Hyphococcus flavus]WDI32724.1 winged helix-turn-helix domain-containing protein [Hyphococcus flavus]